MPDPAAIEQFISITGADPATATFFLSAAQGDTDAAVTTFFESGGILPPGTNLPSAPRPAPSRRPSVPSAAPSAPSPAPAAPPNRRMGGIATLGSLRGGGGSGSEDERNNYYAGGEKSGQMIQDPHKRGSASAAGSGAGGPGVGAPSGSAGDDDDQQEQDNPASLADAIFDRARERGPRTDEERAAFGGEQTFTGAGYRLGDVNRPTGATAVPDVVGRRNVTRNLTFYANGFTIDDGPLRGFDDPDNEAFLSDVNRGVVPREMEEPGVGDVSITLIDKKGEEYVAAKKKVVPFSGGGQRLSAGGPSAPTPPPAATVDAGRAAAATVAVDESRPVASVQIRLSDGTRLIARLNEDSTVGQLRAFVAASRPGARDFTLSTSFPRKVLEDDEKTIKEAQLKGAVVLQTLK